MIVVGKGSSGSWKIRGEQLGAAMGLRVMHGISRNTREPAILVKRPTEEILNNLKGPIVWDVVDAWPQPSGNNWGRSDCIYWMQEMIRKIKPVAIVAATRNMARDLEDFAKVPVKWIPHHGRPGIKVNTIRKDIKTIGYEGGANYIVKWGAVLRLECEKRGWRFVCESGQNALASFDIVVALRDPDLNSGYAPRKWKSNVKLANAHASGTPFIGNEESGYLETMSGFEYWAENKIQLSAALDWLERYETRLEVHNHFLKSAITVQSVAEEYKSWIKQLNLL